MLLRRTPLLLRQALQEQTADAYEKHLLVEHDSLGYNFASGIDLDTQALQKAGEALRERHNAWQGSKRGELVAQLGAAADLYRGSFLEGWMLADAPDFDDWVRLQREIWHRRLGLVFDWLSWLQYEGGEFSAALETTIRWMALDSLNETTYQRLMQSYLAMGDPGATLRVYASCRSMLAEQLQSRPATETDALAERARRTELHSARTHAPVSTHPTRLSMTAGSGLTPEPSPILLDIPLVGRAQEFGTLIQSYRLSECGQTNIALLQGEAGIGKTRLAQEFLGWARAQGADLLQGRAFESGGRLPYQPLVAALRARVEQEHAPDDLLSDIWLAELSRLLPELRDRYPDLPPATENEQTAHIRLFEAIARLGAACAERTTVVLFLDDLQWADIASLDALQYTCRRWREDHAHILFLCSMRTESLSADHALSS